MSTCALRYWLAAIGALSFTIVAITPTPAVAQPAMVGQWEAAFDWPNVGIHVHLLPNGKVLFWGRREKGQGLDPQECTPRLWDPAKHGMSGFTNLAQPKNKQGEKYNLFCSGHTFLADGRLIVVGGHFSDSHGVPYASIFDYRNNTWTPIDDMNHGRWYPTAVTLPDGGVLVGGGTDEHANLNAQFQIWKDNKWSDSVIHDKVPYYPRLHVESSGLVFMSGAINLTQSINTATNLWAIVGSRNGGDGFDALMEYAPAVMYDKGKVVYIGGGDAPVNTVKMIDLDGARVWKDAKPMQFRRRQHNATVLPDGTILVTGGTQGGGFNNLTPGQPIHSSDLWDPSKGDTGSWSKMAKEDIDRCYHSTAVLLPDGRVLSAGGGEYRPAPNVENPAHDTHRNAQIFSPPYLFRGPRPDISSAPSTVMYNKPFDVGTSKPNDIGKVTWIRLSSVTHSFNTNQRINNLPFTSDGTKLTLTAPTDSKVCPPGHYMLFLLNKNNVPSIAKIISIQ